MMMWQHSVPSNPITQTHPPGEDSLSDPPEFQEEETLESQEEYPQEVEEEVEEVVEEATEEEAFPLQYLHNKRLLPQETNLLAIRRSFSQETIQNQRRS